MNESPTNPVPARRPTNYGKGISRIDSGSTHGWFVRGYKNGRTFSKLFSDGKCGSLDHAFELALTYRDKLHTELAKITPSPHAPINSFTKETDNQIR
jgi:hypothetical protein